MTVPFPPHVAVEKHTQHNQACRLAIVSAHKMIGIMIIMVINYYYYYKTKIFIKA